MNLTGGWKDNYITIVRVTGNLEFKTKLTINYISDTVITNLNSENSNEIPMNVGVLDIVAEQRALANKIREVFKNIIE